MDEEGTPMSRPNNMGPQIDPRETSKVIEFNDIAALETTLSSRDVAAVLAEPVMTNIGIIHPNSGYHDALRESTRKYGTYLIIDETHTICTGPGGYTANVRIVNVKSRRKLLGNFLSKAVDRRGHSSSEGLADRQEIRLKSK